MEAERRNLVLPVTDQSITRSIPPLGAESSCRTLRLCSASCSHCQTSIRLRDCVTPQRPRLVACSLLPLDSFAFNLRDSVGLLVDSHDRRGLDVMLCHVGPPRKLGEHFLMLVTQFLQIEVLAKGRMDRGDKTRSQQDGVRQWRHPGFQQIDTL